MLTDKIRLAGPEATDPEDFLGESLGVIFPDDITNQHGDIEHPVIYLSQKFGDIVLQLADPQGDDNRKLFSHFLWNSGLQIADYIEDDEVRDWDVEGMKVMELGAGTGLSGIIAARAGAEEVVITDYPAPEVLANIKKNVEKNVKPAETRASTERAQCWVQGHEWGNLEDEFCAEHKGTFDIIIVADCLWMPWQHENLMKSINHFMKPEGKAWVVAGFHTGRAKMANFFVEETLTKHKLKVDSIRERDPDGIEREFVFDRGIEDVTVRKRWLVVSVLKHKE